MTVKLMSEIREQEFRLGEALLGTVIGGFLGGQWCPALGQLSNGKIETRTAGRESSKQVISTKAKREQI